MDTSFERNSKTGKDEWLTPPYIINKLGEFDLDPCAPINGPWKTARKEYTYVDNGLLQGWQGRVWCNPPYGKETKYWLDRCAIHGNCMVLIFARTDTDMFFRYIWEQADALLFVKGRIKFCNVDGSTGDSAGAPSVLVAYGKNNAEILRECGIKGKFISLDKHNMSINYLVDVLKRAFTHDEKIKVTFDNEEDNINFVLDLCNSFKRQLELDKQK